MTETRKFCPTCEGWMVITVKIEKFYPAKGKPFDQPVYGKCSDCTDGWKKD